MEIDFQKVVTWVLLVLLAGFIGQFGKSLSITFINKLKKKKETTHSQNKETKADSRRAETIDRMVAGEVSLPYVKVQKKFEKARFKMIKKAAKKD
jgi:hypothetical protein